MSLHDRLYAARATRAVQDQERWAEALRGPVALDDTALASVTPLIPAPRGPADPAPTVPGASRT